MKIEYILFSFLIIATLVCGAALSIINLSEENTAAKMYYEASKIDHSEANDCVETYENAYQAQKCLDKILNRLK